MSILLFPASLVSMTHMNKGEEDMRSQASKMGAGRRLPRGMRKHKRMKKADKRRGQEAVKSTTVRYWICKEESGTWSHSITCNRQNHWGSSRCSRCGALRPNSPQYVDLPA